MPNTEDNTNQIPVAGVPAQQQPDKGQETVTTQQPAPQPVQQPAQVPAQQPAPLETLAQQIVQQAPVAQPVSSQPAFELPQGVTDRTKEQFDKLTDNNKKLLDANRILQTELNRRVQSEAQIAPLQQVAQPQQPDVTQFVETDPLTGEQYVNEKKLQEAIAQANDRALRAEKQVRDYIGMQQKKEDDRQASEAFSAYPQLDPTKLDTFDSDFNKLTSLYALDSMMNPAEYGGRSLSFKEAADLATKKLAGKPVAAPSAEAQQISAQAQTTVNDNANQTQQQPVQTTVKEQGGIAVEGLPVNVNPQQGEEDLLALQKKTRQGDVWALAKRLQSVPHTGTPTHSEDVGQEE